VPFAAYICLVVAAMCWGGNTVAGKLAIGHVSPMMLTTIRWFLATALIAAISLPQLKRDWPVVRKNLPLLFFYGIVGYTLFNAMLYSAVKYTTAINVAIEQAGIPMLIFLLNFLFFRTGVSLAQIVGFAMTLLGVALTAAHGDLATLLTLGLNRGDALMLVAVAAYSIYTIFLRWKPPLDWRTLMAIPALGAMLSAVPLLIWEASNGEARLPDGTGWRIALYTATFASLMAQVFYIKGVEWIGPIAPPCSSIWYRCSARCFRWCCSPNSCTCFTSSPWRWRWAVSPSPRKAVRSRSSRRNRQSAASQARAW
jgi:drug/metabolite transporter (DMT)-like permease